MERVILGSPCKPASLQHKWGSHRPERLGGFSEVTQPLKVAELVRESYHSDHRVKSIQFSTASQHSSQVSKFPTNKVTMLSQSYLSQVVELKSQINGPQLTTKAGVCDAQSSLSSSSHRFPALGKSKPLSTNVIF